MKDRAVWRWSPEEPRSWLGYLDADRERYLGGLRENLGCGAWIGGLFLLFGGHFWAALGLFAVGVLLPRLKRRPPSVEALMTLPPPTPTFACTVEVLRDDGLLGLDHGAATFVDGWLHFEGRRTAFALSRADVQRHAQNELELVDGSKVNFVPERRWGANDLGTAGEFGSALDRWFRIDPASKGISVLPPLGIHPSGRVRAWADLASGSIVLAVVAGGVTLAVRFEEWWAPFAFGTLGIGLIFESISRIGKARRTLANVRKPLSGPKG